MSLDVYLSGETFKRLCTCGCGHEHTVDVVEAFYSANITHNLGAMAAEAGIYKMLWRPDEIGITKAGQLIEPLKKGIELMESDPLRFKKHNAENGWGTYDQFLPWIQRYLIACEKNPEAKVSVSR